jgi:hypothetical protein
MEVPVRAVYLNTVSTNQFPDRVLTRISRFVCWCFYCEKTVKWRILLLVCKTRAPGWCRGDLQTKLQHIMCRSSRKYSLYLSLRLLLIHWLIGWYIESSRDVFRLSYAFDGRTVMHRFHFSLSPRMFRCFSKVQRKRDSIKIHARKCWVAVRLQVWTVICILSSGWIIVGWFRWIKNYVNLKGKYT